MKSVIRNFLFAASFATAAAIANAAPISFDFKDPKGVNNVQFHLDAPVESISGTSTGISGTVTFDPEKPGDTKGKIVLETSTLKVGNPMMNEHLLGDNWMNAPKFPQITFELDQLKNVSTKDNATTADATGKLTVHGVTKTVTVPVKLTYLKDKLKARVGKDGDLLVVRTKFTIKRSDYGINAAQMEEKVADEIELVLSLAGAAPR